ncbi:transposase [Streptomyces incanus]|uniref:Transposase n=1 Tax=Streptomyces incanus TaxID=887453 RepID=A0ABW0XLT5_9ACTN
MAAPRQYSDEPRERATRMAVEARKEPAARTGAVKRIADLLDVRPEALRTWVARAGGEEAGVSGTTASADAARLAELKREAKELRRANAILKSAASTGLDVPLAASLDSLQDNLMGSLSGVFGAPQGRAASCIRTSTRHPCGRPRRPHRGPPGWPRAGGGRRRG